MDKRDMQSEYGHAFSRYDRATMTMVFHLENDEGDEDEVEFPCKYEACSLCDGHGSHVNPSIDAHGISAEEFRDDPDFAEAYFSGAYDVGCYRCGGDRVWPVIDEKRCNPADLARLDSYLEERAAWIAESEAERRMGA